MFHDGMQPTLELKKEQYDVIKAITYLCAEFVTNGLCCQVLPGIFDYNLSSVEG